MAKHVNVEDGFTLKDLTLNDGMIFSIENDFPDSDDEQFPFSPNVSPSSAEILSLVNMEDFEDVGDERVQGESNSQVICGIGFDKLKSKMTDVTGDDKVMKLVKKQGVGEIVPGNAQVTVQYVGYLQYTDEPFDSSFMRGKSEVFRLDQGMLLPGLEIGIRTMQKHEEAVFIIHPDLAYGQFGCAPRIPPNEEVLFCVHLVDFLDNGIAFDFEKMDPEERKNFVNAKSRVFAMLNTAKDTFKRQRIKQAIREYQKAIGWLETARLQNDEEEDEANKLLSRAYSNLAVCYNKADMPRRACMACNKIRFPNAKSYFNHGRALLNIGEYGKALAKLQASLRLEPKNEITVKEIRRVNELQRKYSEIEKRIWRNCLNSDNANKDVSEFDKAAREICESFASNTHVMRQLLPEGLTPNEYKAIREQAATFGISLTTHERYDREVVYLNKINY